MSYRDPMTYDEAVRVVVSSTLIVLVCLLFLGCNTPDIKTNQFPAEIEQTCYQAEAAAVKWFKDKHGYAPKIVPVSVELIDDKPVRCYGSYANRHIKVWRQSPHFQQTLEHEFRHMLNAVNLGDFSEEGVK